MLPTTSSLPTIVHRDPRSHNEVFRRPPNHFFCHSFSLPSPHWEMALHNRVVKKNLRQPRGAQKCAATVAQKLLTPDHSAARLDPRIMRPSKGKTKCCRPPEIQKQHISDSASADKQEQADQLTHHQVIARQFAQHIGSEKGEQLFADLIEMLPSIQQKSVKVIPASDANPKLLLCANTIVALGKMLGRGSFSKVYEATFFTLNSKTPFKGVIKQSHRPMPIENLERELSIINTCLSPTKKRGADAPHFIGIDEMGITYSGHDRFEKNFYEIKFSELQNPVLFLADSFAQLSETLDSFHRNGTVLGDIKPTNMLMSGLDGSAVFSDFGTIQHTSAEIPISTYTVGYADPAFFFLNGKSENPSLWAQIKDRFYSCKESDLYAFGFSVERIIYNLLIEKGHHLKIQLYTLLYESRHEHTRISERECISYDTLYPGRCIYHPPKQTQPMPTFLVKRELGARYDIAINILDRLEAEQVFTEKEVRALKNTLYHAIFSLQDPEPSNRELGMKFFSDMKEALIDPDQLVS